MDRKELGGLIQKGKVYDLGMEYYVGMPHHPNHPPFAFSLSKIHGEVLYEGGVSACNCLFTTGGHTGTHLDALGHIALNGEVHGVGDIGPWQAYEGLKKGGIDEVQPVVTRGVLLDIAKLEGRACLDSDYRIGRKALEEAAKCEGCSVEPGDAVLIRTGWIRYFADPQSTIPIMRGAPVSWRTGQSGWWRRVSDTWAPTPLPLKRRPPLTSRCM